MRPRTRGAGLAFLFPGSGPELASSLPWIGGQAPCYPAYLQVTRYRKGRSYGASWRAYLAARHSLIPFKITASMIPAGTIVLTAWYTNSIDSNTGRSHRLRSDMGNTPSATSRVRVLSAPSQPGPDRYFMALYHQRIGLRACGRVLVRRCGRPRAVTARCRSLELSTFPGVENVALAPS